MFKESEDKVYLQVIQRPSFSSSHRKNETILKKVLNKYDERVLEVSKALSGM